MTRALALLAAAGLAAAARQHRPHPHRRPGRDARRRVPDDRARRRDAAAARARAARRAGHGVHQLLRARPSTPSRSGCSPGGSSTTSSASAARRARCTSTARRALAFARALAATRRGSSASTSTTCPRARAGLRRVAANAGGDYVAPKFETAGLEDACGLAGGGWNGTVDSYSTAVIGNCSIAWIERAVAGADAAGPAEQRAARRPFFAYVAQGRARAVQPGAVVRRRVGRRVARARAAPAAVERERGRARAPRGRGRAQRRSPTRPR